MRRLAQAAGVAALVLVLATACSSAPHTTGSDAKQTGAGGPGAVAAAAPNATGSNVVRLGIVGSAADGVALVGVRGDLYQADLGSGTALEAVSFPSGAAAAAALTRGQLDAAYVDPVSAVTAYQQTGGRVRVVAGAATRGQQSEAVLIVSAKFLAAHSIEVQGLLKGEVQAVQLLISNPLSAWRLAAAELTQLGRKVSAPGFARLQAGLRFNCDPMTASIEAQTRAAVSAGQLKAVESLNGLYDLGPVDQLLRSAGLATIR